MPSESSKARAKAKRAPGSRQKKNAGAAAQAVDDDVEQEDVETTADATGASEPGSSAPSQASSPPISASSTPAPAAAAAAGGKKKGHPVDDLAVAAAARNTTGSLGSHKTSRDLQIISFSLTYYGVPLLQDTTLEFIFGRRYGLLGMNGCGKSTMLSAISERDIEYPDHFDVFHLRSEIEASDKTALEAVLECDSERLRLEEELDRVMDEEGGESERLQDIYDRLEALDAETAEMRAAEILHGLGFTAAMQNKKTRDFSGGWRMRIALARALFVKPTVLFLDEPTNHLDLEACVWLEEELKKFNRILVLISHSQDFLNAVCTNIIHMHERQLKYYTGNYDQFCKTRAELEENQMKRFASEQNAIADMKDYIARFGHGSAKLARQAQSKEKVLAKMVNSGLTEKVSRDKTVNFVFPSCGKIPPPVLMVQHIKFAYPDGSIIYDDLDFGVDLDSRIALVGPNGAGKSTLLKLIGGELSPQEGAVRRHSHLKMARFHQHLGDQIDFDLSPLEFMAQQFPEDFKDLEVARSAVGRYGLTGKQQTMPMKHLSDGQQCRVIIAWIAWSAPHMLLLDEPTNHLDIETIDALAEAINHFEGGVILVSHDFRLISQVAKEIWVSENRTINKWPGDILSYKEHLKAIVVKQVAKAAAKNKGKGSKM